MSFIICVQKHIATSKKAFKTKNLVYFISIFLIPILSDYTDYTNMIVLGEKSHTFS